MLAPGARLRTISPVLLAAGLLAVSPGCDRGGSSDSTDQTGGGADDSTTTGIDSSGSSTQGPGTTVTSGTSGTSDATSDSVTSDTTTAGSTTGETSSSTTHPGTTTSGGEDTTTTDAGSGDEGTESTESTEDGLIPESESGNSEDECAPLDSPETLKKLGCADEMCVPTTLQLDYVGADDGPTFQCNLPDGRHCPDDLTGISLIELSIELSVDNSEWLVYGLFEPEFLEHPGNLLDERYFRGGSAVIRMRDSDDEYDLVLPKINLRNSDTIIYEHNRLIIAAQAEKFGFFHEIEPPKDVVCDGSDVSGICACSFDAEFDMQVSVAALLPAALRR